MSRQQNVYDDMKLQILPRKQGEKKLNTNWITKVLIFLSNSNKKKIVGFLFGCSETERNENSQTLSVCLENLIKTDTFFFLPFPTEFSWQPNRLQ